MNINPLGISAYDKSDVTRKNNVSREGINPAPSSKEQLGVADKAKAQEVSKAEQDKLVTMARRGAETSSALAIKAQSDFTQLLSPEEREAIDLLFAKYTENQSPGVNYSARGQQNNTPSLGAKVDFRV